MSITRIIVNYPESEIQTTNTLKINPQPVHAVQIAGPQDIQYVVINRIGPAGPQGPAGSGDNSPASATFTYSGDGRLLTKTSLGDTTNYSYNLNGSLYQVVHPDYTKTMFYDPSGQLTGIVVS